MEKIRNFLVEQYYVPVIRSIDNSTPAYVGELFSPKKPLDLTKDLLSPEEKIDAIAGPIFSLEEAKVSHNQTFVIGLRSRSRFISR